MKLLAIALLASLSFASFGAIDSNEPRTVRDYLGVTAYDAQCPGDCASEQGQCMAQCNGDGQCIGNCAAAHGRCMSRCN